ncbi:NAD(P)/FAD-dependent oxidoreductase [Amycolatopsis sp. GA6-003]|uniref:NAD(P)/FAD-dependent oxidoreductase n=1 Tax=Amycolatopsis sp. GA6-003 TaxID=2652444 RepID=UPI003917620C
MKRIVVVGASLAGVSAAEELRRRGYDGELTLVGAEPGLPYDRPPLSKTALARMLAGDEPDDLLLRSADWYDEHGVALRLGTPASGLDVAGRAVRLGDGRRVPYDGLVVATGSAPRPSPLARALPPAHELRTDADARRLAGALRSGGHLVVVGAGFVGMEVAATAVEHGLDVTVVDVAPVPMSRVFGTTLGDWFRDRHESRGVRVLCSSGVARAETRGERTVLELADGERLTADTVLVGVGTVPATGWLEGSGLALGDGVRCEPSLATAAPGVVAAGDVARWEHPLLGDLRVEHWTNAVEQGRHAAATLLGDATPFATVPMFWTDQHDAKVRCLGRPCATDDLAVLTLTASSVVAVTSRDGVVRGAVCVNAPRQLARLRQAIADRRRVEDLLADHAVAS